jgi:hypothetical protein
VTGEHDKYPTVTICILIFTVYDDFYHDYVLNAAFIIMTLYVAHYSLVDFCISVFRFYSLSHFYFSLKPSFISFQFFGTRNMSYNVSMKLQYSLPERPSPPSPTSIHSRRLLKSFVQCITLLVMLTKHRLHFQKLATSSFTRSRARRTLQR